MESRKASMAPELRPIRHGFLNKKMVQGFSFWTTSACILTAVGASLLAIWEFTGTDVLWRTVATCIVVTFGAISFSWVNRLFGEQADSRDDRHE
jgi:hypothetical protein